MWALIVGDDRTSYDVWQVTSGSPTPNHQHFDVHGFSLAGALPATTQLSQGAHRCGSLTITRPGSDLQGDWIVLQYETTITGPMGPPINGQEYLDLRLQDIRDEALGNHENVPYIAPRERDKPITPHCE
jgi:hypothetical protein